jgi:hypothetical protein
MPPSSRKPVEPAPPTTELDTSKLVTPNKPEDLPPADPAKFAQETTPIGDQTAKDLAFQSDDFEPPDTADAVDDDVENALQRETQDGKGDDDPGESDWKGYATENVEADPKPEIAP